MVKIEIWFRDLTEDVQEGILDELGINGPRDMCWDKFPMAVLEIEDDDTERP